MRKYFSMMLVLASMMFTFSSCSKEEKEPTNPIVGTKWCSSYLESVIVLEFVSNNDFMEYYTDKSGNIKGNVDYGTYQFSNNTVTFITQDNISKMKSATINGSILTLTYDSGFVRTFIKK